jgi:4-carboxymuconolactone decarboxylase
MRRLPAVTKETMKPEQLDLFGKITSGPRSKGRNAMDFMDRDGGLIGPFNAYLYTPKIGDAAQTLAGLLRFDSMLPGDLREIAICAVGQHWQADYEFYAHAKVARNEGVDEATIEALRQGKPPADPKHAAIAGFVREMLAERKVSDATYAAAHAILGDQGMVELVLLAGCYCMVSANLNVFRPPFPDGVDRPFGAV